MAQIDSIKTIDSDALKFIENSIVTDPHQDILFKSWAPIYYIDQKVKSRLLVLTNFRLSVIKDSFPGFSLRQTFLLLNLRSITYRAPSSSALGGNAQLVLTFSKDEQQTTFGLQQTQHGDFVIHIPDSRVKELIWPLLFSAQSIRHGRPPIEVRIPAEFLTNYHKPMPDEQDGLLAAYLAECDRCGTPRRFGVIDHFLACFQYKDHTLNLSHALKHLEAKDSTRDILAIISAIKYFPWFSTILSFGIPLRESLIAIATLFEAHSSLETLIICHAKVTQKGLQALATALATGNHQLHTVSFSDCDLEDAGLSAICDGLALSKRHTIQELCLAGCGFTGKSMKSLCKLFNNPAFASTLRVLDLSRNKLGKTGTESFCQLFANTSPTYQQMRLESLQLDSTELETEKFLTSLKLSHLPDTCLTTLDMSSNRFTKAGIATLCSVISQSRSLYSVTLNSSSLEAKSIIDIIQAARRNQHGVEYALGFANNSIGAKGAKEFEVFYTLKPMTPHEIVERKQQFDLKIQESGAGASLQGYSFYYASSTNPKEDANHIIVPADKGTPLDSVDLSDNNLGNEGIVYVCRAFQVIQLKSLAIDRNFKQSVFSKANEAQIALERFILESTTLEEFSIVGDDKSYYLGVYLTGLLKALAATRLKLRYLDISGNRCMDHAMMALSQYIMNNPSFESLIIDDNRIGFDGLNSLYQAIKTSPYHFNVQLPLHDYDKLLKDRNYSAQHPQIQKMWADLNQLLDERDLEQQKQREKEEMGTMASPEAAQPQPPQQPQQQPQQQHLPPPPQNPELSTSRNTKFGTIAPPPTLTPASYTHNATAPQPVSVQPMDHSQFANVKLATVMPDVSQNPNDISIPSIQDLAQPAPPQQQRRGTVGQGRRASIIQQRTQRFQLGGGSQADVVGAFSQQPRRDQQQTRNLDYVQGELEQYDMQQQQAQAEYGTPHSSNSSNSASAQTILPVHGYQPPVQSAERIQTSPPAFTAPPASPPASATSFIGPSGTAPTAPQKRVVTFHRAPPAGGPPK